MTAENYYLAVGCDLSAIVRNRGQHPPNILELCRNARPAQLAGSVAAPRLTAAWKEPRSATPATTGAARAQAAA
jgi:hypothetical protein